ncbi:MAG: SpoIIIAH-like family protein [Ruminococcaceae bacterium]|nr:SpoIIIAH-like family protein [Oscillospiraceae bacterium]
MKSWKRNAVVATVLLFVCVGIYLNWTYNSEDTPVLTDTLDAETVLGEATLVINDASEDILLTAAEEVLETDADVADYFAGVRLSRQEARDSAIEMLQEAAAYTEDPMDDTMSSAAADLEAMVRTALDEAQIESLVISKGYADCVAFCTDDGISLAVASPANGLTEQDVAKLTDIVTEETEYSAAMLKIIEVGG